MLYAVVACLLIVGASCNGDHHFFDYYPQSPRKLDRFGDDNLGGAICFGLFERELIAYKFGH